MGEDRADPDRSLTAGDLRLAADLSYRQLNDWERKGALPEEKTRGARWRRFTPREVFAMMVCAEIRRSFGVPVERLRFVRECMLQGRADHLRAAVELMATLGVPVWLVTDLQTTFILDSELEFRNLVQHGFLGGDHPQGLFWIKVSPLVNRLLACLNAPLQLRSHGLGYEILREMRDRFGVRSPEEFEVLQLIRNGGFDKVEVVMKDGKIRTVTTEQHVVDPEQQDLTELLRQHEFQTLTVTTRDGRIKSIGHRVPRKVSD